MRINDTSIDRTIIPAGKFKSFSHEVAIDTTDDFQIIGKYECR